MNPFLRYLADKKVRTDDLAAYGAQVTTTTLVKRPFCRTTRISRNQNVSILDFIGKKMMGVLVTTTSLRLAPVSKGMGALPPSVSQDRHEGMQRVGRIKPITGTSWDEKHVLVV